MLHGQSPPGAASDRAPPPAHHPAAQLLVEELLNYEIRINDSANAQFGAFKLGVHDDLATALGLACCEDVSDCPSVVIPPNITMEYIDSHTPW